MMFLRHGSRERLRSLGDPECATKVAMARIVTTQYRYKRPPKKRKPVPLNGPAITTVKRVHDERHKPNPPPPANDDEKPPPKQPAAIVTSRPKRGRSREVPDLTPEEHRQCGDAADALFRELGRRATSKL
jgi:hypothetical protein